MSSIKCYNFFLCVLNLLIAMELFIDPNRPECKFLVKSVRADGNSLFRALAFALENNEEKYNHLRQKSVDYVFNNWELFSSAFSDVPTNIDSKHQYKCYMSEDGVCGTEIEISVICAIYKVSILIYCRDGGRLIIKETENSEITVSILYSGTIDDGHYDALLPVINIECQLQNAGTEEQSPQKRNKQQILQNKKENYHKNKSKHTEEQIQQTLQKQNKQQILRRKREYYHKNKSKQTEEQRQQILQKRRDDYKQKKQQILQKKKENYHKNKSKESGEQRQHLLQKRRDNYKEKKQQILQKKKENYHKIRSKQTEVQRQLTLQKRRENYAKRNCTESHAVKQIMDVITEEPPSDEEACKTEYYSIDVKPEEQFLPVIYPALKTESMEESLHVTTIKEEKDEITSEQHGVCPGRLHSSEEISLAGTTVKEEIIYDITEEQEMCLDSIEQVFMKQDHGTTSSVADVGKSVKRELYCTWGTDPLLLSEKDGVSSCKFLV